MEFHSASFFTTKNSLPYGPKVFIRYTEPEDPWPISLDIKPKLPVQGGMTIHLSNEIQLIQFVNSVIHTYNSYRKDRGYGK